jgi:hypothetical protein
MRINKLSPLLATLVFVFSCHDDLQDQLVEVAAPEPIFLDISGYYSTSAVGRTGVPEYAIFMAEYITTGENGEMGNTVFFQDIGNKQLAGDFVPGLDLDGTSDISYYIDNNRPSDDLTTAQTSSAITAAMDTWDGVTCSELGMTQVPSDGRATGFVAEIFGFGGSFDYAADVTHTGWLPGAFFDLLVPGGSGFILGATFTIVFNDEDGNLIDSDNNGKFDVAWREIYYNDAFLWNIGSTYDVETVALHEAGHGLSQGHFGKAFLSGGNSKLHFSPRAVMNAAYSGVQTNIAQSDNGGHCSNWGEWPNN